MKEIIMENLSWEELANLCRAKGATIQLSPEFFSKEELIEYLKD